MGCVGNRGHQLFSVALLWLLTPRTAWLGSMYKHEGFGQARRSDKSDAVYPAPTRELAARRAELAPETHDAFQAFSRQVFADGALPEKTKQLIAVAVAHVTQCPYCIRSHTRLAQRKGASEPGDHGGDLGGRRDARRRRLRALGDRARRDRGSDARPLSHPALSHRTHEVPARCQICDGGPLAYPHCWSAAPSSSRCGAGWPRPRRGPAAGSCWSPARRASARRRSCARSATAPARARARGARATRCTRRGRSGRSLDVADEAGGELAARRRARAPAPERASRRRSRDELRRRTRRRSLVLEDLHWADEATLDVAAPAGAPDRRVPALVLVDLPRRRARPRPPAAARARRAAARRRVERLTLRAALARRGARARRRGARRRRRAAPPHRRQPVLRHRGARGGRRARARHACATPCSRARRGSTARRARAARRRRDRAAAGRAVAARGARPATGSTQLEACLASGHAARPSATPSRFRHEIARVAVEDALPPHRAARAAPPRAGRAGRRAGRRPDLARLAHHAEAAGDAEAVLRYAPAAGERAAALGAHREAAAQFARALRFADGAAAGARAPSCSSAARTSAT